MSQENDYASVIREDVGEDVDLHDSIDPEAVFMTTRSKMELTLRKYKNGIEARIAWTRPVVLMLTVLPILLVADFVETFGLPPNFWRAFYALALLGSIIWVIKSLVTFYLNKDKSNIEYVIEELEVES